MMAAEGTVNKDLQQDKTKKTLSPAQQKAARIKHNKWLRAGIQLVFFILMPSAFVAGFSGVKYIFQQISTGNVLEWNSFLIALVALCAFTVVFGRFFCGYVCAFGGLGDFVYWISGLIQKKIFKRKKQLSLPDAITPWGQKVKYVLLIAIVLLCAFGIYGQIGGFNPWSVFSFFMALHPRFTGYIPGFILLCLIIIGMAFKERFFCQFLCPMGAVFALLPHLPFANLHRDPESCIKGCQACKMQCPVDIKLEPDGFLNGECVGCEKCADICPKQNLTRWDRKLFRHEAVAVLVKAALFFVLGVIIGISRI